MTTVEEITQMMATLRAETTDAVKQLQEQQQQQEAAAASSLAAAMARTVAVEQEVLKLQAKLEEKKKEHGKERDLFISKKGFSVLPQFDGKAEKYDDWRFKVVTFLEMEDHFSELISFLEKLPKMPTQEELEQWEFEDEERDIKRMNEQLYNFLCLNLKDEALNMVKNMKLKPRINGVASWWKFQHDCQALTGQRIQALANAVYKPSRVKKYADVAAAIERWERDISRFETATGKIAEETKTFSLRQLVPEELDQLITANSNTLKDYSQVKAYVEEQVSIRKDKKSNGPVPMDIDCLAEKIAEEWKPEWDEEAAWAKGAFAAGEQYQEASGDKCSANHVHTSSASQLSEQLDLIMSFMKGKSKGKGKGKSGKGKGGKDKDCWHCGKIGHLARDCWQKDAEMEEYRKGKGKSKGYGKGPYSGYGKGAWEPQGPKGHGKGYGKKGLYWFDQEPVESNNQYNPAWAFAVSEKPKAKVIEKKPRGPPGLAPPIITSISNMYEHLTSDDENCSDDDEVMTDNGKHMSFTIGDAITIATTKENFETDRGGS